MIDKKIINKKIQPRDRNLEAVFFYCYVLQLFFGSDRREGH
jgi:hypothetical protein